MVFIELEVSSPSCLPKKMVCFASIPQWLEGLLSEKFFNSCLVHEYEKKNDVNTFCLDCCISLCPHCLPPHQTHHLLQIRRYVYQDVIQLKDAERLMDCSFVQSYITNSAKVVFLKQRPMARQFKGSGGCIICDRNLQDPYLFCSIACKVNHMVSSKVDIIKRHFYKYQSSLELEDGQLTPDSVLELPILLRTFSGSSSSDANNIGAMDCRTLACTAATNEPVKKKRSIVSVSQIHYQPKCFPASEMAAPRNRRKGVPHRSPMY